MKAMTLEHQQPYYQEVDSMKPVFKKMFHKFLWKIFSVTLVFLSFFLYGLAKYYSSYTLEQILFHLVSPQETIASDALTSLIQSTIPVSIFYATLFAIFAFSPFPIRLAIDDKPKGIQVFPFPFLGKYHLLLSIPIFFYGVFEAVEFLDVPGYLQRRNSETTFFEDYYVFPEEQTFYFPETKQNLIFIFLESMETTYGSPEAGGQWAKNVIPNLTTYSEEHISFSQNSTPLGSGHSVTDTTWTAASIVASTTGLPYKYPLFNAAYSGDANYLPGVTSLGDILELAGYNQYFLMGSDKAYAARDKYLTQHGNYQIYDLFAAIDDRRIPSNYFENWGFEDKKLFEYAKEQLTEIAKSSEPFNYTMLTADTHFPTCYLCDLCPTLNFQIESVVACNDAQLHDFISWVQDQDFYENTTIILLADHLFMDDEPFEYLDISKNQRMLYNCIINPATTMIPQENNREVSNLDFFPTTLAALGVTWANDRLGLGTNLFSSQNTIIEELGLTRVNYELGLSSTFYTENFFLPK